jgi:DNA-binding NarL/FixJ family response regulator
MVSTGRTRIFLIDDHPVIGTAMGLVFARERDLQLCDHATTLRHVVERIEAAAPDLAIIDIAVEGGAALELVSDLRVDMPSLKILCFSLHEEEFFAERALRAGASGYVMKTADGSTLVHAIRCVLRGGIYLSEKMGRQILRKFAEKASADGEPPIALLTNRELRVVHHIGETRSNQEIARMMAVSVKTIEAHRSRIKEKLGLHSTSDLIRFATQWVEREATFTAPTR